MPELGVVIVAYNSVEYLRPCLNSLYTHAEVELEVVVVDNGSSDGSVELVEREFPQVRVVRAENRGFAAGNNAGLATVASPFVLFVNPDTEILEGNFEELLALFEARPSLGLVGCRQVAPDGALHLTIRRFPSGIRYLFAALGSERLPFDGSWLGERVRDRSAYYREVRCDWTSGSFMLARRDVVLAAGAFDERYFLYSEEPDLCLRIRRLGWDVRHIPTMTILHHAGKSGNNVALAAQDAYSRRQYLGKNKSPVGFRLGVAAYALGHMLRSSPLVADRDRRACSRRAFGTVLGRVPPPFEHVQSSRHSTRRIVHARKSWVAALARRRDR